MSQLLQINNNGYYCEQADVYIDPWKPVDKAIITHAHSDHARWGMKHYLAHHLSVPVMKHRLGADISIEGLEYGEVISINGVNFSLHPAGHIPGSAQVRVEYKGEVWVHSGDYKLEQDPLSTPFEAVPCHHFITESTFGLPVYDWPQPSAVFDEMNQWWRLNQEQGLVSMIGVYALGKAQRILAGLNAEIGPIFCHGAVENTNLILRNMGLDFAASQHLTAEVSKSDLQGALVLAPPSAFASTWSKRLGKQSQAFASGWMSVRGQRRRRAADRGFVLSDHADWKGLNQAVEGTGAEHVYVTHGYKEIFAKWLREEKGLDAQPVDTLYEGESEDASN